MHDASINPELITDGPKLDCRRCGKVLTKRQRQNGRTYCGHECYSKTRADDPIWSTKFGWTDDAVNNLRQWWDEGLSGEVIADRLGKTRNSVMGKVHRLGLASRERGINPLRAEQQKLRPKTPSRPKIKPLVVEPPPPFGSKTFLETRAGECKYGYGDPKTPEFRMCGQATESVLQPWCPAHRVICLAPLQPRPVASASRLRAIA